MTVIWAALIVIGIVMIVVALWPSVRGGRGGPGSGGRGGPGSGGAQSGGRRAGKGDGRGSRDGGDPGRNEARR